MEFKPAISIDEFKSSLGTTAEGPTSKPATNQATTVKNPFEAAASFTLGEEGGYVKNDAGKGETNYGVNKTANPDVDVKGLTRQEAKDTIYKPRYWDAINGDEIARQNPTLATIAFDTAFNMGVGPAKQMLKDSGGDPLKFLSLRMDRYRALLRDNPEKFGQYANGWQQRVDKLRAMIGKDQPAAVEQPAPSGPTDFSRERSTAGGANWNPVERTLGASITGGIGKGFRQSLGLGASALALANRSITGEDNNDFQRSMLGYAKEQDEKAASNSGNAPSFTDAAFGDASFKHWLGDSIGYLAYQAVESLATGGAGALIGKTVGKGAVEAVAKGMIEREASRLAATEAGKTLAKEELGNLAAKNVSEKLAAGTALFANNLRQEAGGVYSDALENQSKTGKPVDLTNVWLSSLAATGVDTAADIAAIKGILGKEGSSAKTFGGRAATQVPRQMGIQGGTEYTQSVIEQAGAGKNPFTASGQLEAFNEGAVGALGGIVPGLGASMRPIPEHLQPVIDKAKESNSPLSKAAAEGIKAQPQASAPVDSDARLAELESKLQASSLSGEEVQEYKTLRQLKAENDAIRAQVSQKAPEVSEADKAIADRVSAIEAEISNNGMLRKIDALGPDTKSEFLYALQVARDPRSRADLRQKAAEQIEQMMQWTKTGFAIPKSQPQPKQQPGTSVAVRENNAVGPAGQSQFFDPNTIDGQAVRVDENMIGGPRALVAPGSATASEQAAAEAPTPAASPSQPAQDVDSFDAPKQQQNVAAATSSVSPQSSIEMPRVEIPAGEGPAAIRKRKAQIAQLVQNGFGTVEKRGDKFVLRNPKTGQSVTLDSPADVQMARQAVTQAQRKQADATPVSEPSTLNNENIVTLQDAGRPIRVQIIGADEIGKGKQTRKNAYILTRQDAETISAIGSALGVQTRFFRGVTPGFEADGIYNQGNTILLGEQFSRGPLNVFMHEFTHLLESQNPKAYASVVAVVRSRVKDPKGYRSDYYGKQYAEQKGNAALTDDELRELIGDLGGDMMKDASFWSSVFADVQAKHGKEAQGIIAKLVEFLNGLLAKAASAIPGKDFNAQKFVSDVEGIRSALKTALAAYVNENAFANNGVAAEIARAQKLAAEQQAQSTQGQAQGTQTPGSDAGNGFKHGPEQGTRYRVGVVSSVGGAVSLEKRLPAGTVATFYVGKDGSLVDADDVNLRGEGGRSRLWIPPNQDAADQAVGILDEMGKLSLSDPARKDAKQHLKALVEQSQSQEPVAPPKTEREAKAQRAQGEDQKQKNIPDTDTQGWKLHLNLKGNEDSANKISDYLTQRGIKHKVGRNGGQAGKDMTIYVGSRDKTNDVAKALDREFGPLLHPAEGEAATDDIPISGNVWGRFEIGRHDPLFHQYGVNGVPFLNHDMGQLRFQPDRQKAIAEAKKRADDILKRKYGSYYTGTAQESAPTTPKTEKEAKEQSTQGQAQGTQTPVENSEISWSAMTPDQRRRYRLEKEIATGTTNNGGVIAKLKPSAIQKRQQELAAMGDAGRIGESATAKPVEAASKSPEVVLQNRDRSSAASIAQMQGIASNPDYLRVGTSREMQSGSPVVFGDVPKSAAIGRKETIVDGKGDRVQAVYAVVEASDLIPSNRADGTAVPGYANGEAGKLRAVAGNGRTAGIQEAYSRGNADDYRKELIADAKNAGIDPEAVKGMKQPVLVRVMRAEDITPDMGDRTNITGTQKLSPVEQAANDARRFDVSALTFTDAGEPTFESVRGFIQSLPVSERGDMLNKDGTPTRQAIDRLMAAAFKQAYESDELVQLYAQAVDPDARAVISAVAEAAGPMAALRDAGEFDVRRSVSDAAKLAVNASRKGLRIADAIKNADLDISPEAFVVAEFLASNIRSAKRMAEGLRNLAKLASEQAKIKQENEMQAGMFGAAPTLDRKQVLETLNERQLPQVTRVAGDGQKNIERQAADTSGAESRVPAVEGQAAQGLTDQSADGIKVIAGKGLIKGEFNVEVDGDGVPGGPFDTQEAARAAALAWREELAQRARNAEKSKANRDAIAQKFRDGTPVTAIEIKSLGLQSGTSDVRDFFGIAADLFGLKSRDIRPIVKDLIRVSHTDMGAKREYVATRKALEAIGQTQASPTEIIHNNTRIYQTKIKSGDVVRSAWAVETADNKARRESGERAIGGDSLHNTLDDAKKAAEFEAIRDAEERNRKQQLDEKAAAEKELDETKAERNRGKSISERRSMSILDSPAKLPASIGLGNGTRRSAMEAAVDQGRAIVAVQVRDQAAKKRDEDAVERARRAGYILGLSNENIPAVKAGLEAQSRIKANHYQKPEYRVYSGSDTTRDSFAEISKTEYEYAQQLIDDKKAQAAKTEIDNIKTSDESLLTAPTPEEVIARQDAIEAAKREAEAANQKAAEDERKRRERDEVKARSEAAADTFELGMDPMENLGAGQRDIFGTPSEVTTKAERNLESMRRDLIDMENRIMGQAGLAPGFLEDALRSRKVPKEMKDRRNALLQEMRNLRAQTESAKANPTPSTEASANTNTIFTEDAAAKARELLRKKLYGSAKFSASRDQDSTTPAPALDAEVMMAGITLSGYHIEKGSRTFSDYGRAMLADLGEAVRPYLKSWYMGVKYDPRAIGFTGMDSASEVDAANVNALTAQSDVRADSSDAEEPTGLQTDDSQKLTPDEAKALMDWQDLGQKDGVKTQILTFYESQADKDAKRGRMTIATITKGDRSSDKWTVDGDDQKFTYLAAAKKRARDMGLAKLVSDGFVENGENKAGASNESPTNTESQANDGVKQEVPAIPEIAATEAKSAPAKAESISIAERHNATMEAVREGRATPEQFKASFDEVANGEDAIKAELGAKTKAQLLSDGGPYIQMRYANDKKDDVVDAVYRQMLGEYVLGQTISYGMGRDSYQNAVRKLVEATDEAKLADYAKEREAAVQEAKSRREARIQALQNPQALDDFNSLMKIKISEGMTRQEAFLSLTPEQRIRYDELAAESTKEARDARKRAVNTEVRAAGQSTGGEIIATKHTRDGYDLFVVRLSDRLSKEDYNTVNSSAKRLGGWYSSFRGNGATPGFQFKTREAAEAFLKLAGGDTSEAKAQTEQRRNAFEDDRSQTAVERLREMADKTEAAAEEELGRERKSNTARRARFASASLNAAESSKAMARTMRNIAQAIQNGKAKFLDAVRTRTQVEMLAGYVRTAKDVELRAKYSSYAEQEKRRGEPATAETAGFAEFPTYTAFRSDLATLARQLSDVEGTKKIGQKLLSVADDVTDAYLEFAKSNLNQVSQFGRGDALADFGSRDAAEKAIRRSGLTGKAIVLPVKRGQNRVILSPSEAINRGIWQGDGDKRITLSADLGAELVEAIGKRGNKQNKLTVPWQFQTAYDRRKALSRIGIETPSEFRSALREFIGLQEQAITNKVRELELAMVGRKADGLDFFPTPAAIADQMVDAADIQSDMAVLEPSAGMGHIADRIRAAGAEPDVIEISPDRRDLLQEKGYHLAEVDDFMLMEPRKFFTYGDVFRAPDGTEGIMRGVGHMGSQRVRLEDEAGNRLGLYNRDELTGVAHRGSWSGYDRIIMNPPFSNRRDAEHVRHAFDLLKPGGRIVAIMGEGVFFGQDKRAQEFRDWLDSVGGTSEKLPDGSFMDSNLPVNTGVNARMVVIDKPSGNAGAESMASAKLSTPRLDQDEADVKLAEYNRRIESMKELLSCIG